MIAGYLNRPLRLRYLDKVLEYFKDPCWLQSGITIVLAGYSWDTFYYNWIEGGTEWSNPTPCKIGGLTWN